MSNLRFKDEPGISTAVAVAMGTLFGTALLGAVAVTISALMGWLICYLFPETFIGLMTVIGLKGYSAWQLCAWSTLIAILVKQFRK